MDTKLLLVLLDHWWHVCLINHLFLLCSSKICSIEYAVTKALTPIPPTQKGTQPSQETTKADFITDSWSHVTWTFVSSSEIDGEEQMATKNCRQEPSETRHLVETEWLTTGLCIQGEFSPHASLFSYSAKRHCEEKSCVRKGQGPGPSTFRDKYEDRPRRTVPSHHLLWI